MLFVTSPWRRMVFTEWHNDKFPVDGVGRYHNITAKEDSSSSRNRNNNNNEMKHSTECEMNENILFKTSLFPLLAHLK